MEHVLKNTGCQAEMCGKAAGEKGATRGGEICRSEETAWPTRCSPAWKEREQGAAPCSPAHPSLPRPPTASRTDMSSLVPRFGRGCGRSFPNCRCLQLTLAIIFVAGAGLRVGKSLEGGSGVRWGERSSGKRIALTPRFSRNPGELRSSRGGCAGERKSGSATPSLCESLVLV